MRSYLGDADFVNVTEVKSQKHSIIMAQNVNTNQYHDNHTTKLHMDTDLKLILNVLFD